MASEELTVRQKAIIEELTQRQKENPGQFTNRQAAALNELQNRAFPGRRESKGLGLVGSFRRAIEPKEVAESVASRLSGGDPTGGLAAGVVRTGATALNALQAVFEGIPSAALPEREGVPDESFLEGVARGRTFSDSVLGDLASAVLGVGTPADVVRQTDPRTGKVLRQTGAEGREVRLTPEQALSSDQAGIDLTAGIIADPGVVFGVVKGIRALSAAGKAGEAAAATERLDRAIAALPAGDPKSMALAIRSKELPQPSAFLAGEEGVGVASKEKFSGRVVERGAPSTDPTVTHAVQGIPKPPTGGGRDVGGVLQRKPDLGPTPRDPAPGVDLLTPRQKSTAKSRVTRAVGRKSIKAAEKRAATLGERISRLERLREEGKLTDQQAERVIGPLRAQRQDQLERAEDLKNLEAPTAPREKVQPQTEVPPTDLDGLTHEQKVGKAQNKNVPEEVRQRIEKLKQKNPDKIAAQRRGVRTHSQTKAAAAAVKPSMLDRMIKGIQPGTGMNVEEVAAMQDIVIERAADIIEKAKGGLFDDFASQFLGGQAEAGRVLNYLRKRPEVSSEMVEGIRKGLKEISDPEIRKQVEKTLKAAGLSKADINPGFIEKFVEFATAIKLTGISTHVKGIVGNSVELLLRPPVKAAGGVAAAGRRALLGTEQTVFAREALAEIVGISTSFGRATKRAWNILKSEDAAFSEATKAAEAAVSKGGAIGRGGKLLKPIDNLTRRASGGRFGLNVGAAVRSTFRAIGAVDGFFKELNDGAGIYARIARQNLQDGKSGLKFINETAEQIRKTPDQFEDLIFDVQQETLRKVFQERLDGWVATVNQIRQKHPMSRLIVPFFNTPVNLLKRSLRILPGGTFFIPSDWNKFGYFGRGAGSSVRVGMNSPEFYEMIGQQMVGGLVFAGLGMWAWQGKISGSGETMKDTTKRALQASGWQENSVKFGDVWVSYQGFEPMSSWMRSVGDGVEGRREGEGFENVAKGMLFSYLGQYMENPFLTGVNNMMDALNDPEGSKMETFVASMATGSTVPVILQQWGARAWDPVIRKPKGTLQKIQRNMPGLSKNLLPLRDVFGNEITREAHGIAQAFGFKISTEKKDPTSREIRRLALEAGLDLSISKPDDTVAGKELSPKEHDRLIALVGVMNRESLAKLVNSPAYGRATDAQRVDMIGETVRDNKDIVRYEEFSKYYMESR